MIKYSSCETGLLVWNTLDSQKWYTIVQKETWINEAKTVFQRVQGSDILENNIPVIIIKDFLNYAMENLMSEYVAYYHIRVEYANHY